MKLFKILILIVVIFILVVFFYQNYSLNPEPIWVWLYPGKEFSMSFPLLMALTLMAGVLIGFMTAIMQIFTRKSETSKYRSQVKKLNNELDTLRNQPIEDNLVLSEEAESVDV